MTQKTVIIALKNYQKSSPKKQEAYLRAFTPKMIYRTTKTENPETSKKMVNKVLNRI